MTSFIGELTPWQVAEAVQKAIDAYLGINQEQFNPDGKQGGFFCLGTRFAEQQFLLLPFGKIVDGKVAKYTHFASQRKPSALRYNPSINASAEIQSADHAIWGGAVAITLNPEWFPRLVAELGYFDEEKKVIEELVGAFSGLSADGDEGVVVSAFLLLKLITRAEALAIFNNTSRTTGNNKTGMAMMEHLEL